MQALRLAFSGYNVDEQQLALYAFDKPNGTYFMSAALPFDHPFNQSPAIQAADLNKVQLTHEEQTLIIMLLRDMDEPTYKGRVIFRDSILEKYMATMTQTPD